jgi:hypothetical protein
VHSVSSNLFGVRFQVNIAVSMAFRDVWDVGRVVTLNLTDVSEVRSASMIRAMIIMVKEVGTSETSVNFNVTTRPYVPQNSELQPVL